MVIVLAILSLAYLIFDLSWKANSKMMEVDWVPGNLALWADSNARLRTGLPLLGVGLASSAGLILRGSPPIRWLQAWIAMVIVVAVAEVGQIWLPERTADIGDVATGALGAALGLALGFSLVKALGDIWILLRRTAS